MVNYKRSVATAAISATLASAQNVTLGGQGNVNINLNFDFDYTTIINQIGPNGWYPETYTVHQACPTPCGQPAVPMGWDVYTTLCTVCGPEPTLVEVTSCPYKLESPSQPTPVDVCDTCHYGVVEYGGNHYTQVISTPVNMPTAYPQEEDCEYEHPNLPVVPVQPVACPEESPEKPAEYPVHPETPVVVVPTKPEEACPTCYPVTPTVYAPCETCTTLIPVKPQGNDSYPVPPVYEGAASSNLAGFAGLLVAGLFAGVALL